MNRMSVERRRFLRGGPGAAMAHVARGTGRAETGMGAHLSVAYEDVGRQIASDVVGFSYESAILATGKTRRAHPARPAHLASRRGRMGMPYAAGAFSQRYLSWPTPLVPLSPSPITSPFLSSARPPASSQFMAVAVGLRAAFTGAPV